MARDFDDAISARDSASVVGTPWSFSALAETALLRRQNGVSKFFFFQLKRNREKAAVPHQSTCGEAARVQASETQPCRPRLSVAGGPATATT
ncbi:hypothetical protein JCGZ_04558 [Jatropha curcas]|uniref:Uncharacterized protein n=1 Tax=Jatropha curcas TaxID=180498 RepID=A0A067LPZ8_JATCU|nr:hypothetical protein JCGZ_04558 [Jatropha curcas]